MGDPIESPRQERYKRSFADSWTPSRLEIKFGPVNLHILTHNSAVMESLLATGPD